MSLSLYILLMGVQGSGKGTQAAFLQNETNIPHISTGDLFRAMKTRTDDLARSIQETMNSGKLISDEQTNAVVKDRLAQQDAANGAILDGYPRTIPQAEWLENHLTEQGKKLNAVILLQLDPYVAFKRTFGRVGAKGEYNIYYNDEGVKSQFVDHDEKAYPPRLDATLSATGEKLLRRPDDASADAILKRIDTFMAETQVLIPHYRHKRLLYEIPAEQPIDVVRFAIKHIVDSVKP
ncbi:MAG: nucleoside monophosphate kinase [Chitinophagaceae bacterium]|nr:nucleoside monophosphate kinase [Anaerolineae bacterium]